MPATSAGAGAGAPMPVQVRLGWLGGLAAEAPWRGGCTRGGVAGVAGVAGGGRAPLRARGGAGGTGGAGRITLEEPSAHVRWGG